MSEINSGGGCGLTGTLLIVFVVLKLAGLVRWSWIWVFSPIWIVALLIIVLLIVLGLGGALDK